MGTKTDKQRQAISAKLKKMRIEAGYTSYEKFALEKLIDPKQYWRIEENKSNFRLSSVLNVVNAHNVSLEEFFKGL